MKSNLSLRERATKVSEYLKDLFGLQCLRGLKDWLRVLYFSFSLIAVCIFIEGPFWAILLILANFLLSVVSVNAIPLNDESERGKKEAAYSETKKARARFKSEYLEHADRVLFELKEEAKDKGGVLFAVASDKDAENNIETTYLGLYSDKELADLLIRLLSAKENSDLYARLVAGWLINQSEEEVIQFAEGIKQAAERSIEARKEGKPA